MQHGWILKTLCQLKETSHKKTDILWFNFYEMIRIGIVCGKSVIKLIVVIPAWFCDLCALVKYMVI